MTQLVDAYCLPCQVSKENELEPIAQAIANQMVLKLTDISEGADTWFAVMPHPKGAIQLHYDWFGECFWLTPTGTLSHEPHLWEQILDPIRTNFTRP